MSLVATCQDCGKRYRVPTADRTYPCKACGGSVAAASSEGEMQLEDLPADASTGAPKARSPRVERSRERVRSGGSGGSKVGLYAAAGVVLLGTAIWFATRGADVSAGETDLTKVMANFDEAWNGGDLKALGSMFHPDKSVENVKRLELLKDKRGWAGGFLPITSSKKRMATAGDVDAMLMEMGEQEASGEMKTSATFHETESGGIVCNWQFSPVKESWYMYALEIPPPDLAPRVSGFDAAWNAGDPAALRPFLTKGKEDALFTAFAKVADRRAWEQDFLPAELNRIVPTAVRLKQLGFTGQYPKTAKAYYDTERGEMMFRWKLDVANDEWSVRAIDPPNR